MAKQLNQQSVGTFRKRDSPSAMTAGIHILSDGYQQSSAFTYLWHAISNLILHCVFPHLPWLVFIRGQGAAIKSLSWKKH